VTGPKRATPLLERQRELAVFARLLEEARGGRGGLSFVEGPPGIGKTRLLEEARLSAASGGMDVFSARASELDREFPFGVIRQAIEPALLEQDRRESLLAGAAASAASLFGFEESAPSRTRT
jgi:predicted ATPase